MSLTITQFLTWLFVWLLGCLLFDGLLGLDGGWLMLAGALTYMGCEFAVRMIKVAADD